MSRTGTKYVGTIRHMHGNWEETRAESQTEGLSEIWPTFNGRVNFCERRRREPLGALGASPPRKFSNLKILKRHFQHSGADSCVEMVPKIDRYFLLNFDKERCHQL